MTLPTTKQQNGRVQWIGNYRLPIPLRPTTSWDANRRRQRQIQRVAFMRKCGEIFTNINENLTEIGIILLNKLPAGVHVVVAPQPQRISAVKLPLRYFITNRYRIGFNSGERPWRSSL